MNEIMEYRSYESVNYILRPKKQIERKIIIEILQELDKYYDLSQYLYIGFGSIYYYDFILFHKFLKLHNFISIDDKSTKKRFAYNRPYDFISFENIKSTEFLNKFDWKNNAILWLDYDKKINEDILGDLKTIAKNCKNGDILLITLNAYIKHSKNRNKFMQEFLSEFGKYISTEYQNKKYFTPKHFTKLLQHLITNILESYCEYREIKFSKLFCFKYKDGVPMFTIGGIFNPPNELSDKEWVHDFICTDEKIVDINVPILTHREKFYLDSHLEELKTKIIEIQTKTEKTGEMTEMINENLPFELPSFENLKNYLEFYKYYPQYHEGII